MTKSHNSCHSWLSPNDTVSPADINPIIHANAQLSAKPSTLPIAPSLTPAVTGCPANKAVQAKSLLAPNVPKNIHATPVLWQRDACLPADVIDVLQECQNVSSGNHGMINKSRVQANLIARGSPGQHLFSSRGNLKSNTVMGQFTLWQLGLEQRDWDHLNKRNKSITTPGPAAPPLPISSVAAGTRQSFGTAACDEENMLGEHDDTEPCTSGRHPLNDVHICSICYFENVQSHLFSPACVQETRLMVYQTLLPLCEECSERAGDGCDDCTCFDHTRERRCEACFESDLRELTDSGIVNRNERMQRAVNSLATGEVSGHGNTVLKCALCEEPADPADKARWCAGCENLVSSQYYTNVLGARLLYEATCAPPGWRRADLETPAPKLTKQNSGSRTSGGKN